MPFSCPVQVISERRLQHDGFLHHLQTAANTESGAAALCTTKGNVNVRLKWDGMKGSNIRVALPRPLDDLPLKLACFEQRG